MVLILSSAVVISSSLLSLGPADTMHNSRIREGTGAAPDIDTDGDGIRDVQEDIDLDGIVDRDELYPTHPFIADTDGDGLHDGEELDDLLSRTEGAGAIPHWIKRFLTGQDHDLRFMEALQPLGDIDGDSYTNLIDADTDGDGLDDGEERDRGTDHLDPDSDGDMVPDAHDSSNGPLKDADLDGLDDDWEAFYGQDRPDDDPDGDGVTNIDEFALGGDPLGYDADEGRIDLPSPFEVRDRQGPGGLAFKTQGIGPAYLPMATFGRLVLGEWQQVRDPLDGIPGPIGGAEANFELNGYWLFNIPSPYGTYYVAPGPSHPTYPVRASPTAATRFGQPYTEVPIRSYTAAYDPAPADPSAISDVGRTSEGYLSYPADLDEAVFSLSGDIELATQGMTPSAKAEAIIAVLHSICIYSDEPTLEADSKDPVYDLLFMTNRGDSLDFSTAFTIIARTLGIPARMVMGYAIGQEGDLPGERVFLQGHLHVWSEICLEGGIWAPVEPSPGIVGPVVVPRVRVDGVDPYVIGPDGGDGGGAFHVIEVDYSDPDADPDGDGLTNAEEALIGTLPGRKDTDGDGLWDGEEFNEWGSDPNRRYTDSDTLPDGDEVNIYRTRPDDPDTDGGGLDDGMEVTLGLDPLDPLDDRKLTDYDLDGLPDLAEGALDCDPLDPDTDGDGLLDMGSRSRSGRTLQTRTPTGTAYRTDPRYGLEGTPRRRMAGHRWPMPTLTEHRMWWSHSAAPYHPIPIPTTTVSWTGPRYR